MRYFLKYLTQLSWPAALLLSVGSLALWIPDFLVANAPIGALVATMLLSVVNAFIIMLLFYHAGVTRYRVGLPMVSYLLLMAAFPAIHADWRAQVAIVFIAPVVLLIHNVHLNPETQEESFVATLLICVSSLFMPTMIWLVPVLWVGFVLQQALSLRTFLASLMAIAVFALYYAITWFLAGRWGYVLLLAMPSLSIGWFGPVLSTADQIRMYVLLAVMVWFVIELLIYIDRVSMRERTFTLVFLALLLTVLLMTFFPIDGQNNSPLPVYAASVMATLYFQQRESIVRGVFFLCFILLTVLANVL